ncbi:sigma-54-dependent transcriptional regulator [Novipirellula artificiosorum]|uniref:Transcriptional regulatory protein ZraR n=1 Tax=Novipirellula artificiosorum TaxID=2528016 RepID=A0A5C6CUU6_9BACT|nr:sigma-54 dependent transcriptional regulator [Novipirellula artificiosorum]TWU28743.1 Transcriptional regulatory protein ZraR [Novipirellula artificiosorum]
MPKPSYRILIVDDERSQRQLLGSYLQSIGYDVSEAASAEEMLDELDRQMPDMILLDVRLPGLSGIESLPSVRQRSPTVPILLITAYADLKQAVASVKAGASDYLSKPIDLEELRIAVEDALHVSSDETGRSDVKLPPLPRDFVLQSEAMRELVQTVAIVAPSDAPLLILGPSGAGKEGIAKLIHQWSTRHHQPFLATNCGAMPENLVESELFGHVKGAFTGATENREGLFRAASGGTLFLDEIGELPIALQPKLLRALESQQITPVGTNKPIQIDVRLVAATNRDLGSDVREGRFREDLYYRINVIELTVPSLAVRRDDILPLAKYFAAQHAGRPVRLSPQSAQQLLCSEWPGNVRQLRNTIQRACLLCRGDIILPEHLGLSTNTPPASVTTWSDTNRLSQVERATIVATLSECDGNRTHAAEKLGISRRTLITKLKQIEGETDSSKGGNF